MRFLGICSLSLTLVACSSASNTPADGGDAPVESNPEVGRPDSNGQDTSSPDSNTADPDASDANVPDSSTPDGDGGDGGAVSCDDVTHDPVLGTAQLGAGYRVVDSAALPVTSWLPVAAVEQPLDGGLGIVVYGYNGDGRVHRLGVWPDLAAPDAANVAFDAVSPAHRTSQVLITPLLVTTRGRLLAGYRTIQGGGFASGGVSIFDTVHPDAGTRWLSAPGIESAMSLGAYFLVGGAGLGSAAGGLGVYGVNAEEATLNPVLVAKYPAAPASETVRPGLMAVTALGVPVLGHYLDLASRHSVRLAEPSALMEALSGGPAIDLASAPEVTEANDVANLTSFWQGVAVLHTREGRGVLPALGRLDHYPLSRPGGDAGTAIGAPATMLSASDGGCTVVSQLVPVWGSQSVIVGLWDRNGQRLVRVGPK
jgi:hypothetical protein